MLQLKLCLLSIIVLLLYCAEVCQPAGNYTIGFEGYSGDNRKPHATNPPKLNPTQRPSSHRPNPTHRPSSPKPIPTYRPSSPKPNPTYRPSSPKPNYTQRPPYSKPNPTIRPPSLKPNPTNRPASSKPSATYWPPKTTPAPVKTTSRPAFRRTTSKPVGVPKPTIPPLWNIWAKNYAPSQPAASLDTKTYTNNFKNDATLFGLYTIMRNIVGVTLSQTGQSKPLKKPLRESYPYYYAVYHYNRDREKVASRIIIPYDSVGYCEAGTSDRTCVPGTYALCLLDWTIMCITYSSATFQCNFNTSLQCATSKVPCDSRDPICASMGNHVEVQTPCVSNVVVTQSSSIAITQDNGPDPYANVVPGPLDLCATTILEIKRLESPVGAFVGLLTEIEKLNVEFLNNFNASHYTQPVTLPPPALGTAPPAVLHPNTSQTGNLQPETLQPGHQQSGNLQPGNPQSGNLQPGYPQQGNLQPGNTQLGNSQLGNPQPGNPQFGNPQLSNLQPGNVQPVTVRP